MLHRSGLIGRVSISPHVLTTFPAMSKITIGGALSDVSASSSVRSCRFTTTMLSPLTSTPGSWPKTHFPGSGFGQDGSTSYVSVGPAERDVDPMLPCARFMDLSVFLHELRFGCSAISNYR